MNAMGAAFQRIICGSRNLFSARLFVRTHGKPLAPGLGGLWVVVMPVEHGHGISHFLGDLIEVSDDGVSVTAVGMAERILGPCATE